MERSNIVPALVRPGMYTGEQGDRTEYEWKADAVIALQHTPTYSVFHHVAYEGQSVVFQGTREEVKEWLKTGRQGYYLLDDLEIYCNNAPDVYALANED